MRRSLRVVLATIGSRGDVQPMLALAQALAARGHVVRVAAPANFEHWVRGLGFAFAPLGVDMQVYLSQNRSLMTGSTVKMLREVFRYFKEQVPAQALEFRSAAADADILVYGGLASFIAPSVAQCLGLPALGVQFTTSLLPSSAHPPPVIRWHGLPGWLNDLIWRVDRFLGNLLIRGTLNTMRAGFGLPPVARVRDHLMQTCPLVLAVDETLFPPDPRWQGRYPYANFLYFADATVLDPELEAWLDAGEAPVFVGFGSMSGSGTDRIERLIIEALSGTGRRCIVGAGWAGLGAGQLPPDWRMVREAPHALLFPRMAVVVHHGGSGTVAQALRAGVPQVLLPLILDQFHHAHLLYRAALAPRPIPMERITAAELGAAIAAALALPPGPRQAAAVRLRASDGCADLVQRIEAMVPL